jgi:phage shock protein PspC (stress-responsive transcriptional regulator)
MWFVVMEIGLALVLVFLIAWLTLPRKPDRNDDQPPASSD